MSVWIWIAICGAAFFLGCLVGDSTNEKYVENIYKVDGVSDSERMLLDTLKYKMNMVKSTFDILEATAEDEKQKEVIRLCRENVLGGGKND